MEDAIENPYGELPSWVNENPEMRTLRRVKDAVWRNLPATELAKRKRQARKYFSLKYLQRVIAIMRAEAALKGVVPTNAPLHPNSIDLDVAFTCVVCKEHSRYSPCKRCSDDPAMRATYLFPDGSKQPWYVEAQRNRNRHARAYYRNRKRLEELGGLPPKPTGKKGRPKKAGHPVDRFREVPYRDDLQIPDR